MVYCHDYNITLLFGKFRRLHSAIFYLQVGIVLAIHKGFI